MFSIIISEKGGAERKESFDKNEINVGRVQGNDLMLPKGNVSKHHARLLYRDGRFIVTDLKSTNGTYVNGRKIAQATIVREGDKIYIGDFVLRLDSGSGAHDAPQQDDESVRTLARQNNAPPAQAPVQMSARGAPAGNTSQQQQQYADDDEPPAPAPERVKAPVPRAAPGGGGGGIGASAGGAQASPVRGHTLQLQGNARGSAAPAAQAQPGQASQQARQPIAPSVAPAPVAVIVAAPPARVAPRETAAQAARRLALITLVDRIAEAVDLSPLKASPVVEESLSQLIDRTARDQAAAMRDEGEAPEGTDLEQLVRDALRELVELGPIGPLLDDDEVTEIHVLRNDQVLATRGTAITLADASFTSEEALARVVGRLAQQSGEPAAAGDTVVERRLARGAHMVAIAPPASGTQVLVIRKRRRVDATLEDLVRSGAMSRPMAVFLDACVQARANVLVCGPAASSTTLLLAALSSAAPTGERIVLVHDQEEIGLQQPHVVSLSMADPRSHGEGALRAAAKLRADRLVIGAVGADVAAATVEVISEGAEGVVAAASAPTMRQALSRLVSQVTLARPGVGVDAARESVAEAFDIAVEVTTIADGRPKVLRIAELGGADAKGIVSRDLFTYSADTSGEGTFVATGVVPRVVGDFAARGVKVDPNVFKRSVGR
jgi:pilus assembly protein CpaF